MNLAIDDNSMVSENAVALGKLLDGLDCRVIGDVTGVEVSDLANDSRKVKPNDLFFAVPGYKLDGTRFIPEAASMGAVGIVTQTEIKGLDHIPVIVCDDIRRVMSRISASFFGYPAKSLKMIGVTGTNGKTTITYMLGHLLGQMGERYGKLGTVEYSTGKRVIQAINTTPDTIEIQRMLAEMRDSKLSGCVMEVSSHGLDQARCDDIEYSAAVFTNLTQDHLDYHKDFEGYFRAKSILFEKLLKSDGIAVLNANDPYSERLRELSPGEVITYSAIINGSQTQVADIVLLDKGYMNNRRNYEVKYKGKTYFGSIPYLGKFNLMNAAASLATLVGLGYDLEGAIKAMISAPQVPGRVEKIEGGQPFEVIIDYAHTPDALENLLTGVSTNGRKIVVFGCGGDRDKTKRPIMGQVAAKYGDLVFVTSDNPRTENPRRIIDDILVGIPSDITYEVIEKRDEAICRAMESAGENDLVIIAGKGHEDYQVIGNTRHYFSDPKVVEGQLKKMGYAGS